MEPGNSSSKAESNQAESNGQLIPERVAELAGELSEAETIPRRRQLAKQIAELASRSRPATRRRVQSRREAAVRRARAGSSAAGSRIRASSTAAGRRMRASGGVARRGMQVTGTAAARTVRASGQWLAAQVVEMAPKVPVRSIATLRAQYPGRSTEELAESLIIGAARASAGIGAAVGVAAAVPFIPTAPVELGVETLALVAIELKLIAELHEVYGTPAAGSAAERMTAYVGAWANRRGVRITSTGLALAVGSPMRRKLERRLLAKAGQGTLALAPLLTGAVVGAAVDHHETRRLGGLIRDDLRKQAR
jgi:hypothetical protein